MDNLETGSRLTLATPINVDISNNYNGVDRGLFSIVSGHTITYARIVSATFRSNGPTLGPGLLSFKIETFPSYPLTPEDYAAGIQDDRIYDTYTVGSKTVPIMIEYWGKTAYFNIFANASTVDPLNPELVENIKTLGDSYTKVLMGVDDGRTITTEVNYIATSTAPLTMVDYTITVHREGQPDVDHVVPLENITPLFDPVLYIRGL